MGLWGFDMYRRDASSMAEAGIRQSRVRQNAMPVLDMPVTHSTKAISYTSIETLGFSSLATYVAEKCAGILLNGAALSMHSIGGSV